MGAAQSNADIIAGRGGGLQYGRAINEATTVSDFSAVVGELHKSGPVMHNGRYYPTRPPVKPGGTTDSSDSTDSNSGGTIDTPDVIRAIHTQVVGDIHTHGAIDSGNHGDDAHYTHEAIIAATAATRGAVRAGNRIPSYRISNETSGDLMVDYDNSVRAYEDAVEARNRAFSNALFETDGDIDLATSIADDSFKGDVDEEYTLMRHRGRLAGLQDNQIASAIELEREWTPEYESFASRQVSEIRTFEDFTNAARDRRSFTSILMDPLYQNGYGSDVLEGGGFGPRIHRGSSFYKYYEAAGGTFTAQETQWLNEVESFRLINEVAPSYTGRDPLPTYRQDELRALSREDLNDAVVQSQNRLLDQHVETANLVHGYAPLSDTPEARTQTAAFRRFRNVINYDTDAAIMRGASRVGIAANRAASRTANAVNRTANAVEDALATATGGHPTSTYTAFSPDASEGGLYHRPEGWRGAATHPGRSAANTLRTVGSAAKTTARVASRAAGPASLLISPIILGVEVANNNAELDAEKERNAASVAAGEMTQQEADRRNREAETVRDKHNSHDIGTETGAMTGGLAGAAIGATIGSIVPVFGTILGGLVGGFFGGWGGGAAGGAAGDAVGDVIF